MVNFAAAVVAFALSLFVSNIGADSTTLIGVASATTYSYRTKVLSTGDVVVAGYTTGSFSGFTNAGSNDFFVQKYSVNGTLLWTQQIGSTGSDLLYGLDADTSGNIYVAGGCAGALDNNTYAGPTGVFDVCFVKYDTSGTKLYSGQIGSTGNDIANDMVVDSANGYFYLVGQTTSNNFNGQALTGYIDQIWLKYDTATGTLQAWYQSSVSNANAYNGIALDSAGNSWIVGSTLASSYMSLSNSGSYDITLQKLSPTGTSLFVTLLGGSGSDFGSDICTDVQDNVYIGGYTSSSSLNGETTNGGYDILLYKFDSSGNRQYTKLAGGSGLDRGYAIAVDNTNNIIYVTGLTRSTSFYGSTTTGVSTNYLLGFATDDGSRVFAAVYAGTSGISTSLDLTVGNNQVYLAGYITGDYESQTLIGTQDGYLQTVGAASTARPTTAPSTASIISTLDTGDEENTTLSAGALAGIVVGAVVALAAIVLVIVWLVWQQLQQHKNQTEAKAVDQIEGAGVGVETPASVEHVGYELVTAEDANSALPI